MSAVTLTGTPLRKLALAAASLAVVAPVLTSCGFDYATNRPNVIANGGYAIHGNVKVLAARIVASAPGAGAFVATISNRPQASGPVELTSVTAPGLTFTSFKPISVAPGDAVNLADKEGIATSGTFGAGDAVPVTLTFSNGTKVQLSTVVVTACHEYSSATPSAAASGKGSGKATGKATDNASGSASASAGTSAGAGNGSSATASPYSCDYPSLPAFPAS